MADVSEESKEEVVFSVASQGGLMEPLASPVQRMSFVEADQRLTTDLEKIPDKMAFKIGEVAKLLQVKTYVLRYWETEFKALNPRKSKHNQRIYSRKDVELLFIIRKLLYQDRFSIEGARSILTRMRRQTKKAVVIREAMGQVEQVKNKVHNLLMDIQHLRSLLT